MSVAISVIIPVYNTGKYLRECLESVVNQDFDGDYEIIIIDDGSTDKSPAICREYAAKHENAVVVSQKNKGLSGARNAGLKHARGEYVIFLDSDDYLSLNCLSALHRAAVSLNADVVTSGARLFGGADGEREYSISRVDCGKRLDREQFLGVMSRSTILISCLACNKLIRRKRLAENGIFFPMGRKYEDTPVVCKLYFLSDAFACISEITYHYRQNIESSITGNPYRSIRADDINDSFTSAEEVLTLPCEATAKSAVCAFKRSVAGGALVLYAEYQLKALEALAITDKLEKEYILFGASTWAERYLKLLKGRVESVFLADNDKKKHGKEIYGHMVISPQGLLNAEHSSKSIIIASMYFMEIYTQLKKMGAVKSLSEIMPFRGETRVEALYTHWINRLEAFWM